MKKVLPIVLIIALVGTVCAHIFLFTETCHFIADASVNDAGDIALVDNTETRSRVFSLDNQGEIRMMVDTPLIKGGLFLTRPMLVVLPDGGVLVKESHVNYSTYFIEEELIMHYTIDGKAVKMASVFFPNEVSEKVTGLYGSALGYGYFLLTNGGIERYELNLDTGTSYLRESIAFGGEITVSQMVYTKMGTVLLDATNVLYLHDDEEKLLTRLYPQEGVNAVIAQIKTDAQGNLLVRDEGVSGLLRVDATGKATLIHDTGRRFAGEGSMIRDMLTFNVNTPDRFVGVYADARRIIAVEGNVSSAVRPHRSVSYLVVADLLVFFGLLIIALVIVGLFRWWASKERLFPVIAKQLAFGLPVIMIGTAVLYMVANASIGEVLKNQYHGAMYDAGIQKIHGIDEQWLSKLDLKDPRSDPHYAALCADMLEAPSYHVTASTESGEVRAQTFYYYWLTAVRDGSIVTVACEDLQIGLPIRYLYSEEAQGNYQRVLAKRTPVYCSTLDVFGSWLITLIPIYDGGEIVGILEVGTNSSTANAEIQSRSIFVAGTGSAIMLLAMMMVMLMVAVSLRPLQRMKTTMQLVADGQYGLTVKVRSHDEIAQLGRIFNILSQTIIGQIQNLTSLNSSYYRFVPLKTMDILGGKDVKDVELGDQTLMDMIVLQMSLDDFDSLITSMSAEKLFQLLNEVHETFVPLLNRYGGVIDRYTESGWISLFTGDLYDAIATGVDMMARLSEYNELRAARGERPINLGVAIAQGPVMVGIVGQRDRVSAMAISEVVNMTQYMLGVGRDMGSRILLADTQHGVGQLDFSSRWLGKMSVAKRSEQIDIYDCFDGDAELQRMRKTDTAGDFLAGVTAYVNGEYYKARKAFIDVLRVNPSDVAATAYLLRCDEEFRRESTGEGGAMFVYS